MKDMEITNDWIDRYNENELNEEEKEFFRKRLEVNPLLRTEVYIDECLNKLYQDEGTLDLVKKIQDARQKSDRRGGKLGYLLLAASILYLMALAIIFNRMHYDPVDYASSSNSDQNEIWKGAEGKLLSKDNLKIPVQERKMVTQKWQEHSVNQYLSLNYMPLPDFELLVGSVTRSSQITIKSPASNWKIAAGYDVKFEWVSQNRVLPVNILFYNNAGNLIFETPALLDDSYILNTKDWPGGIYYWKIILDEEMILLGKLTLF
jgi:hypothetical protein